MNAVALATVPSIWEADIEIILEGAKEKHPEGRAWRGAR